MSKKELTEAERLIAGYLTNLAAGFEGASDACLVTVSERLHTFLCQMSSKKTDLGKCEQSKSGGFQVPAPLLCEAVGSIGTEETTTKGKQSK